MSTYSSDVQSVEDQDVVVVLGQGHHVALTGYLEATTSGDLYQE